MCSACNWASKFANVNPLPPFYFRLFLTELWNRDTLILQKLDHASFDFPVVLWRETYLLCPNCKTNYRLLLEHCQSF
nr:MAG TPA: hypothetical protein [Caudoviricetes sp.]